MAGLLGKIIAILTIVLLLPTGLVLASQNAIPGDSTYPVKRQMENVLTAIFSLHPVTRAYFRTDLSKRRFKEAVALIKKGDRSSKTSLTELVVQTKSAGDSLVSINDKTIQNKMTNDLIAQIDDYNKNLSQLEQPLKKPVIPSPTPRPSPTTAPATQTIYPTSTPILPTPTLIPTSAPVQNIIVSPDQSADIRRAIDELNKLREELERVRQRQNEINRTASTQNPTPTSTPAPTLKPTLTPTAKKDVNKIIRSIGNNTANIASDTPQPALSNTPPNPPIAAVGYCTGTTITLTWEPSVEGPRPENYKTRVYKQNDSSPVGDGMKDNLLSNSLPVTGEAGQTYNWIVIACNSVGCSNSTAGQPIACPSFTPTPIPSP